MGRAGQQSVGKVRVGLRAVAVGIAAVLVLGCTAAPALAPSSPETQWAAALLHPDARHRITAVHALAALGEVSAPILVEALWDQDLDVRDEAADALAGLGPRALPALREAIDGNRRLIHLRRRATEVLARMGPQAAPAIPSLLGALGDADAYLRYRTVAALESMGEQAAPAERDLEVLLAADEGAHVRFRSAMALGRIGDRHAVAPLREALRGDDCSEVRACAARSLAELCAADAVQDLGIALLTDRDEGVRAASADALAVMGDRAGLARTALREALTDGSPLVRLRAARALEILSPA